MSPLIRKLLICAIVFILATWVLVIPMFFFVTSYEFIVPSLALLFSTIAMIMLAVTLAYTRPIPKATQKVSAQETPTQVRERTKLYDLPSV